MTNLLILCLVVALVLAVVMILVIRTPHFVPRKIIVEEIQHSSRTIMDLRLNVHRLLNDCLDVINHPSTSAIQAEWRHIQMKQQDLGRNLESIDQKLAPYSRPHAQKRFYAAASAAARIMQQNLTTINQLCEDVMKLEPVVRQIIEAQRLAGSSRLPYLLMAERDQTVIQNGGQRLEDLLDSLERVQQQLAQQTFQTDEFHRIGEMMTVAITQTTQDYQSLRHLLNQWRTDEYNDVTSRMGHFLGRFDMINYQSIAAADMLTDEFERPYITDLYAFVY